MSLPAMCQADRQDPWLLLGCCCADRGHSVTVVVTTSGLAFAKRAAARHSSNTTAEAMHYINFKMQKQDIVETEIERLIRMGQNPGKYSSKQGYEQCILQ